MANLWRGAGTAPGETLGGHGVAGIEAQGGWPSQALGFGEALGNYFSWLEKLSRKFVKGLAVSWSLHAVLSSRSFGFQCLDFLGMYCNIRSFRFRLILQ